MVCGCLILKHTVVEPTSCALSRDIPYSRTNYHLYSFSPHTIRGRNSLPNDVVLEPILASLKQRIFSLEHRLCFTDFFVNVPYLPPYRPHPKLLMVLMGKKNSDVEYQDK